MDIPRARSPRAGRAALAAALAATLAACGDEMLSPGPEARWDWNVPAGFPVPRVPADNPMSEAKVSLGRHLFYDRRLSGNVKQSCASCHRQELAFAETRTVGVGSTAEEHPRNSMGLTNTGYQPVLNWADPGMLRLEDQALGPIFGTHPVELGMAGREAELLQRLRDDDRYRELFPAAFPGDADPVTVQNLARALGAFQRTLISANAPYDRYTRGDANAISAEAKRGEALFQGERMKCARCHAGPMLASASDWEGKASPEVEFFNTGLYNVDGRGAYPAASTGIVQVTGRPEDMGRFKAPSLRNVELTAPYFHDGSAATLDDVLDHYAAGGRTITIGPNAGVGSANPYKSGHVQGFALAADERAALLAYLRSLTDREFVTNRAFSNPWPASSPNGTP